MDQKDFNPKMFGKTLWIVRPGGWPYCPACESTDAVVQDEGCPLCLGGELWASVGGGSFTSTVVKDQINRYHYVVPCILTSIRSVQTASGSKVTSVWVDCGSGVGKDPVEVHDFRLLFLDEESANAHLMFLNYRAIGETLSRLPTNSRVGFLMRGQKKS